MPGAIPALMMAGTNPPREGHNRRMKMGRLTTADMLRDARRRLATHRRTRPVTPEERAAIVSAHQQCANQERRASAAFAAHNQMREALSAEREALIADMHAEAWQTADWHETERALSARVAYYEKLLESEK